MLSNHLKLNYNNVIFMRPDVYFEENLRIDTLLLVDDKTIILPEFHSWFYKNGKHYLGEGINDRFAICNPITAIIYGLRFDGMLEYSKRNSLHSETYLKYTLEKSKLKIIKDARICFNRIRINNIRLNDCKIKNYILYLYLEKIIELININDNIEIPKIDNIRFNKPIYKILENKIYDFEKFPNWTNIHEYINKNNDIIDKKYMILKHGLTLESYTFKYFNIKRKDMPLETLTVGDNDINKTFTFKMNENTKQTDLKINLSSISKLKNNNYDNIVVYAMSPISDKISNLIDNRIEQKRLKKIYTFKVSRTNL
jgi:hypothetical protein